MTFGEHWYWGVITLGLVLIPGLYRTARLALEMKWRNESWVHAGKNLMLLAVFPFIWPIFSILL